MQKMQFIQAFATFSSKKWHFDHLKSKMMQQTGFLIGKFVLMVCFIACFSMESTGQIKHPRLKKCVPIEEPNAPNNVGTLCDQYISETPDIRLGVKGATTLASQFLIPANGFSNQTIFIEGSLIVDIDLSFTDCIVRMWPGTSLTTHPSGVEIEAIGTDFFSCHQMWRGITLLTGSSLIFNSCQIEDAQYALTIGDGVSTSLINNVFNRNFVGIRNASGGVSNLNFQAFYLNIFRCHADLHDPYQGQQPAPGNISLTGFQLQNTSVVMTSGPNIFSSMRNGIIATNSSIGIRSCDFKKMMEYPGEESGNGIKTIGGTLQAGNGCSFEDNEFAGISTFGTKLYVNQADFNGKNHIGISSLGNKGGEVVNIRNNDFNLNHKENFMGIYLERSLDSNIPFADGSNSINTNTIHIGGISSADGIHVKGILPSTAEMEIIGNIITVTTTASSVIPIFIHGLNSDKFRVEFNKIYFNSSNTTFGGSRYGIFMLDCSGIDHYVHDNEILGGGNNYPGQCGIHAELSQNITFCYNTVDRTSHGFHFVGDCKNAAIKNNTIQKHKRGLFIESNAGIPGMVGPQTRHGNCWSTNFSDYNPYAALCLSDPTLSPFFVETTDPAKLPSPSLLEPSSGWFFYEEEETNYCDGAGRLFDEIDMRVSDEENWETYSEVVQWDLKRNLYKKLYQHPELLSEYEGFQHFFDSYPETSFAQTAYVESQIKSILQIPASIQEQIGELQTQMNNLFEQLTAMEAAFPYDDYTDDFDEIYMAEKLALLQQISQINSDLEQIKTNLNNSRMPQLLELTLFNQNLETITEYETAYQFLNQYRINRLMGIEPTEAELQEVDIISKRCLEELGHLVGLGQSESPLCAARTFIAHDGRGPCIEDPEGLVINSNSNFIEEPYLYPNPASEKLWIRIPKELEGRWFLFSTTGTIVRQGSFVKDIPTLEISLNNLLAGLYYFNWQDKDKKMNSQKVVLLPK